MGKRKGKTKKIFKYIFTILVILFGVIQFIRIDKTNPKVEIAKDFISIYEPSEKTEKILRTACYDCHSNETVYPWYSNIAPVSWWLKDHVDDGRKHLNFSIWGDYKAKKANHKLHECAEELEEDKMPLNSYTLTHGDAKLSTTQKEELAEWFESLMTEEDEEEDEEHDHEH
ncbi:MAG: hypothetical protein ACI837_002567 [Crocinitomicaceae bacterium]|jgi:hypothetical protein